MADRKLTPKQLKFIERYNVHGNSGRAAKEAGYRGNPNTLDSMGQENLRKPAIAEAIRTHAEKVSKANEIDASYVYKKLKDMIDTGSSEGAVVSAMGILSKCLGMQNHAQNLNIKGSMHGDLFKAIKDFKEDEK